MKLGMEPVLETDHLSVVYESGGRLAAAVNDVSLKVYPGQIVGLVGESGSGKSTLAYAVMRLLPSNALVVNGTMRVMGQDIYQMSDKQLRSFRWNQFSMVFQSALVALNPVLTIERQFIEIFHIHRPDMNHDQVWTQIKNLMELVRINPSRLRAFPHELSGGMRQRIVIAMAIALDPALVIMDEPTTALDSVVQRDILLEIRRIQESRQFAVLFISHDLRLVQFLCQEIGVMYAGKLVEVGHASALNVQGLHHPYTEGLMAATPTLTKSSSTIQGIGGQPPDLLHLPSGCAFHPRCRYAQSICRESVPKMRTVGEVNMMCHIRGTLKEQSNGHASMGDELREIEEKGAGGNGGTVSLASQ